MTREYEIEKQWITESGLDAAIIMTYMGHRCGYVGVKRQSDLFGKDYNDIDSIDVHGGLTYSGCDGEYPIESDLWWFGFDTAHYGDNPEIGGQSLEYCIEQCELMANQLIGMEKQNAATKN